MAKTDGLDNIANLTDTVTSTNTINNNTAAILDAFNNTLSLDGSAPNQMQSNLDMNSNQILNLPSPATTSSPARLIDVTSNPTIVVPPVGTSGAVVGLLNANKTDSGNNTFNGVNTFASGQNFSGTQNFTNISASGFETSGSYNSTAGSGNYNIASNPVLALNGNYTNVINPSGAGNAQILLGNASDPQAYIRGTNLVVQNTSGTTAFTIPATAGNGIIFQGSSSGTVTLVPFSAAASGTIKFPNGPGTLLSTAGATVQNAAVNPAGTASGSAVMMGLGSLGAGCTLTPLYSTRILVTMSGQATNNTGTDGARFDLRFGSGAPPANGVAVTGTLLAGSVNATNLDANQLIPFSLTGIATGLTPGTTYWFDMSLLAVAGGTAAVQQVVFSACEI